MSTIPAKEPQEKLDTDIDSPPHPDNDSDVAQAGSKTDEEKRDHRDMRRLGKAQELKVCSCMHRWECSLADFVPSAVSASSVLSAMLSCSVSPGNSPSSPRSSLWPTAALPERYGLFSSSLLACSMSCCHWRKWPAWHQHLEVNTIGFRSLRLRSTRSSCRMLSVGSWPLDGNLLCPRSRLSAHSRHSP